jgi:hypothetical protein
MYMTYLSGITRLKETGTAIEDWLQGKQASNVFQSSGAYQWELQTSCLKLQIRGEGRGWVLEADDGLVLRALRLTTLRGGDGWLGGP